MTARPATPDMDAVLVAIGDRIREAREQRGWSQRELARRVEVRNSSVSRWESGDLHLTVAHLLVVAAALEVAPASLLDGPPEAGS